METVRNGVFETNSSSTHSLTYSDSDLVDFRLDPEVLRSGVIEVVPRYFGQKWERFYRPENKISYLLMQVLPFAFFSGRKPGTDLTEDARKASPRAAMLLDAVEEATGCKVRMTAGEDDLVGIDHESKGLGCELFESKEGLLGFVFSPSSYVQTGNDNLGPNEFIPDDMGRKAVAYPDHYADSCTHEDVLKIRMRGVFREFEVSSGDRTVIGKTDMLWGYEVTNELREAVLTKARVKLKKPWFPEDEALSAQDVLHHLLANINMHADEPRIRILKDLEAETTCGDVPGYVAVDSTEYELEVKAPKESVEAVIAKAAEVAGRTMEDGFARKPAKP